jgi:hypothetical protein
MPICLLASGKTYTIYGTDEEPGLTRYGVSELFKVCSNGQFTSGMELKLHGWQLFKNGHNSWLFVFTCRE